MQKFTELVLKCALKNAKNITLLFMIYMFVAECHFVVVYFLYRRIKPSERLITTVVFSKNQQPSRPLPGRLLISY
jgi:hypothetical protein